MPDLNESFDALLRGLSRSFERMDFLVGKDNTEAKELLRNAEAAIKLVLRDGPAHPASAEWTKCPGDVYIAIYKRSFVEVREWSRNLWAARIQTFEGLCSYRQEIVKGSLEEAKAAAVEWIDERLDRTK
jgi:hypothetical protein